MAAAPLSADDRWAISDLMVKYCLGLDRKDYDLLGTEVLAEDAYADYGTNEGVDMKLEGRAALLEMLETSLAQWETTHHLTGAPLIEATDEGAVLTAYLTAQHVRPDTPGGDQYIIAGIYTNGAVRTDAGWRLSSIRLDRSWTAGNLRVVQGMYDEMKSQAGT